MASKQSRLLFAASFQFGTSAILQLDAHWFPTAAPSNKVPFIQRVYNKANVAHQMRIVIADKADRAKWIKAEQRGSGKILQAWLRHPSPFPFAPTNPNQLHSTRKPLFVS